jgi:hypothetical protein
LHSGLVNHEGKQHPLKEEKSEEHSTGKSEGGHENNRIDWLKDVNLDQLCKEVCVHIIIVCVILLPECNSPCLLMFIETVCLCACVRVREREPRHHDFNLESFQRKLPIMYTRRGGASVLEFDSTVLYTSVISKLLMCFMKVWPALAVIGGVDRGLRVGGQCIHKPSGRKAVVLGTLKQGLAFVKVQWDDAEASVR